MGRKKLSEDRKKKKLSTTVNAELFSLYEEYTTKKGIKKSTEIEKLLKSTISNEDKLKELLDLDILIDDNLIKNIKK